MLYASFHRKITLLIIWYLEHKTDGTAKYTVIHSQPEHAGARPHSSVGQFFCTAAHRSEVADEKHEFRCL